MQNVFIWRFSEVNRGSGPARRSGRSWTQKDRQCVILSRLSSSRRGTRGSTRTYQRPCRMVRKPHPRRHVRWSNGSIEEGRPAPRWERLSQRVQACGRQRRSHRPRCGRL